MAARVLTTDTARETVTAMQSMVQTLGDQVRRLDQQGQRLSQPDVWDGPKAQQFRGEIWPTARQTLQKIVDDLDQLRSTVQSINADIMAAGS